MSRPKMIRCAGRMWEWNPVDHAWQSVRPAPTYDGYISVDTRRTGMWTANVYASRAMENDPGGDFLPPLRADGDVRSAMRLGVRVAAAVRASRRKTR